MAVASPQPALDAMDAWGHPRPYDARAMSNMPSTSSFMLDGPPPPIDVPVRSGSSMSTAKAAPQKGSREQARLSVPALTQSSALVQADRRASDGQANKKRPQSCDICRSRKVKCVLPEDGVPGRGKCKQCQANNVQCTYKYIPKRPGPQTTSAKSIARREERERQANATALAAAAKQAGIRDKGRPRAHFHHGTGSTPPSSNDASRMSSAVVSQHTSPHSVAADFRHLGVGAADPAHLMHHHQTGLYEPPRFAEHNAGYYEPLWDASLASEQYLHAHQGSGYGMSSPMMHDGLGLHGMHGSFLHGRPGGPHHAHGFLKSASSSRRNSLSGSGGSGFVTPSHGTRSNNVSFPSLSRPGSPSHSRSSGFAFPSLSRPGSPSWTGCLHDASTTHAAVDPVQALKSLSRPSSPRSSSTLPAGDVLHPLTEPLHALHYPPHGFPVDMLGGGSDPSLGHSNAALNSFDAGMPPFEHHHLSASAARPPAENAAMHALGAPSEGHGSHMPSMANHAQTAAGSHAPAPVYTPVHLHRMGAPSHHDQAVAASGTASSAGHTHMPDWAWAL